MSAKLLELIRILLYLKILALGCIQISQALNPQSCALPLKVIHVLVNYRPCWQETIDIQLLVHEHIFIVLNKARL